MDPESLQTRRKAMDLTQQELADQLGVARNTVSRWEANTMKIPPFLDRALRDLERELKQKK